MPKIEIHVPVPSGYREQLAGIEVLFGRMLAPYFPGDEWLAGSGKDKRAAAKGSSAHIVDEARGLWEGWRDMEEYAREVFPVEEEANGLDWMI